MKYDVLSYVGSGMDLVWWYTSRTSGVVAAVAMLGSVVGGMSFSARNTGTSIRRAWWLRAHTWLATVAMASTAVHLVAVYFDGSYGIGLGDLVVPGATPWALSFGVVAGYLFVAGVATSWPRRRLRPRWWRVLHLGLVVSVAGAGVHGFQSGTDTANAWWRLVLSGGAGILAFVVLARLLLQGVDWYGHGKRTRVSTSESQPRLELPDQVARDRRVEAELDARVAERLASTGAWRHDAGGLESRPTQRYRARRSSAMADRARALALLGATGVLAAVGSFVSSAKESRTGDIGTVLGQPSRGAEDFDGELVETPFGSLQVRARFVEGRLTDIAEPGVPSSSPLSRQISAAAVPELRSEALQTQTAEVDAVSGASYTSAAYRRSLQSAIDRARAADATTIE